VKLGSAVLDVRPRPRHSPPRSRPSPGSMSSAACRDGVDPTSATMTLTDYGESVMPLAVWGLEAKTLDPYLAGLASASSARPRAPCGPDDQQRPRSCHAIREPLSRRGRCRRLRRLHGRPDRRGVRLPSSPTSTVDPRLRTVRPNYAVSWRPRGRRNQGQTSPFGPAHRRDPRRGTPTRRERRRQPDPGCPPGRVEAKLQPPYCEMLCVGMGRYLHLDLSSISAAGDSLTAFLRAPRSLSGPR
jgi:hypothetical protein